MVSTATRYPVLLESYRTRLNDILLLCDLNPRPWNKGHLTLVGLEPKAHKMMTVGAPLEDLSVSFLHPFRISDFLRESFSVRPVHSMMLSSHLILCLPLFLPPDTVPCRIVLARPPKIQGTLTSLNLRHPKLTAPFSNWNLTQDPPPQKKKNQQHPS